jgi:hypothetical protein
MDSVGDFILLLGVVICGGAVYMAWLFKFIDWIIRKRR